MRSSKSAVSVQQNSAFVLSAVRLQATAVGALLQCDVASNSQDSFTLPTLRIETILQTASVHSEQLSTRGNECL